MATVPLVSTADWSRAGRLKISGIVAVVALLHIAGWSLYLSATDGAVGAGAFAGAGMLAYVLGIRHAFDADHIAAIDDTTRLMVQRGRRPVGVGFFFAMGHSSVVVALSLVVALAAGIAGGSQLDAFREVGGVIAEIVAAFFLSLVAILNAMVLHGIIGSWRAMRRGELDEDQLERQLLNRGLVNRILGGRARALIRSSWHMFPLGILFGLGLETATEITLLTLSASAGQAGSVSLLSTLSLPLLFAAGMSAFDTVDGLLMSIAYSWSSRNPARRLYYNIVTTSATVIVAALIGSVYLAGLLVEHLGVGFLEYYASLADHFELLGYVIVGFFLCVWVGATVAWRLGRFESRYSAREPGVRATDRSQMQSGN